MLEFEPFPKIPRLSRECVITEKIDGTNGVIEIDQNPPDPDGRDNGYSIYAGSRNRWLTEKEDNYGFWKWVNYHKEVLIAELGIGRHYGEWWGIGIGRGYDIFERRFSLFNTARWKDAPLTKCHVVPVLYTGEFETSYVEYFLTDLHLMGSKAAPGFMRPEGVVIYHKAGNCMFKKTLEMDGEAKGSR